MQKQSILKESCCLCIEGVRGQKERANKKMKKLFIKGRKTKQKQNLKIHHDPNKKVKIN